MKEKDDPQDLIDYHEELDGASPQEKYQKAFSIIASFYGQRAVNDIIRRVVESNIDEDGNHRIPQAVKGFRFWYQKWQL
ncbi:hypothetical protein OGZ01_31705 (plasmid) [Vibrio harveyi]|nr:hypothetical protein [Vibrio harveyi]